MALLLSIARPGSPALSYHRVASLTVITNEANLIEVASCVDEEGRRLQLAAKADGGSGKPPAYAETRYVVAPYDEGMSVTGAYAHLKSLPEFAGAEDA